MMGCKKPIATIDTTLQAMLASGEIKDTKENRSIHEFLNAPIFEKITVFKFYAVDCCSFNFTEFYVKWKLQNFFKNTGI